jgi:hypothetical protein
VAGRPHGSCARQILFADTLDSEHSQANREHRVVTLTIPVAEAARPRRVQVAGNRDAQTIEPQTAGGAQAIPARPPAGQAAPTGTS